MPGVTVEIRSGERSLGSGVVVGPTTVLTARHVIPAEQRKAEPPQLVVRLRRRLSPPEVDGDMDRAVEHVRCGPNDMPENDWALLTVTTDFVATARLGRLSPATLDAKQLPQWRANGFPSGRPDCLSGHVEGFVDASGHELALWAPAAKFQTLNARIRGFSGAAVFHAGCVVGHLLSAEEQNTLATGRLRALSISAVLDALGEDLPHGVLVDDGGLPHVEGDLPSAPFPGLRPYLEEEARVFYGRHDELRSLIGLLSRDDEDGPASTVVQLAAPPGTGKSSLLRAGLLPRLRAVFDAVYLVVCEGQRHPGELVAATLTLGDDRLAAHTANPDGEAAVLARAATQRAAEIGQRGIVFAFDQVERCSSDQLAWILKFAASCDGVGGRLRILIVHRSDFVDPSMMASRYGVQLEPLLLRPLGNTQVRQILLGAARDFPDLAIPSAMPEHVANTLSPSDQPDGNVAVVLQVVLAAMWKSRPHAWDIDLFNQCCKQSPSLHDYLRSVLGTVHVPTWVGKEEEAQEVALEMLHLHTARESWEVDELVGGYQNVAAARQIHEALVDKGLLLSDGRQSRVIHDAMIPSIELEHRRARGPGIRARRRLGLWNSGDALTREDVDIVTTGLGRIRRPSVDELCFLLTNAIAHEACLDEVLRHCFAAAARPEELARCVRFLCRDAPPERFPDASSALLHLLDAQPRDQKVDLLEIAARGLADHSPESLHERLPAGPGLERLLSEYFVAGRNVDPTKLLEPGAKFDGTPFRIRRNAARRAIDLVRKRNGQRLEMDASIAGMGARLSLAASMALGLFLFGVVWVPRVPFGYLPQNLFVLTVGLVMCAGMVLLASSWTRGAQVMERNFHPRVRWLIRLQRLGPYLLTTLIVPSLCASIGLAALQLSTAGPPGGKRVAASEIARRALLGGAAIGLGFCAAALIGLAFVDGLERSRPGKGGRHAAPVALSVLLGLSTANVVVWALRRVPWLPGGYVALALSCGLGVWTVAYGSGQLVPLVDGGALRGWRRRIALGAGLVAGLALLVFQLGGLRAGMSPWRPETLRLGTESARLPLRAGDWYLVDAKSDGILAQDVADLGRRFQIVRRGERFRVELAGSDGVAFYARWHPCLDATAWVPRPANAPRSLACRRVDVRIDASGFELVTPASLGAARPTSVWIALPTTASFLSTFVANGASLHLVVGTTKSFSVTSLDTHAPAITQALSVDGGVERIRVEERPAMLSNHAFVFVDVLDVGLDSNPCPVDMFRLVETSGRGICVQNAETTVLEYDRCVQAGACEPRDKGPGCQTLRDPRLPAQCVTLPQARAHCAFKQQRLPTQKEWVAAALFTSTDMLRSHIARSFLRGLSEIVLDDGGAHVIGPNGWTDQAIVQPFERVAFDVVSGKAADPAIAGRLLTLLDMTTVALPPLPSPDVGFRCVMDL